MDSHVNDVNQRINTVYPGHNHVLMSLERESGHWGLD